MVAGGGVTEILGSLLPGLPARYPAVCPVAGDGARPAAGANRRGGAPAPLSDGPYRLGTQASTTAQRPSSRAARNAASSAGPTSSGRCTVSASAPPAAAAIPA